MSNPHDSLFTYTFGQPEFAAELLRSALPPVLADAIDWRTLTRCDAKLGDGLGEGLEADLLFSVDLAGRPAFLLLLLEHKSTDDPMTVFQLLRYVVRIWERCRKDHPGSTKLPPILPFVLHHGPSPWTSSKSLRGLIDIDRLPRALANAVLMRQPELTFVLDDLATQSEEYLMQRASSLLPRAALLCMQHLRGASSAAAMEALGRWLNLLRELFEATGGQDAYLAIHSYIARVADLEPEHLQTVFVQIHEQAAMIEVQYMRRFEREAMARGIEQGRAEGQTEILLRQLAKRFSPLSDAVIARVRAGTQEQNASWADRLSTAPTLDDVFRDA